MVYPIEKYGPPNGREVAIAPFPMLNILQFFTRGILTYTHFRLTQKINACHIQLKRSAFHAHTHARTILCHNSVKHTPIWAFTLIDGNLHIATPHCVALRVYSDNKEVFLVSWTVHWNWNTNRANTPHKLFNKEIITYSSIFSHYQSIAIEISTYKIKWLRGKYSFHSHWDEFFFCKQDGCFALSFWLSARMTAVTSS